MYIYFFCFLCFSITESKKVQYFKPFYGLRNEQISRAPGGAAPWNPSQGSALDLVGGSQHPLDPQLFLVMTYVIA